VVFHLAQDNPPGAPGVKAMLAALIGANKKGLHVITYSPVGHLFYSRRA
jgi:hypothetical protein